MITKQIIIDWKGPKLRGNPIGIIPGQCVAQVKYDGEFNMLYTDAGQIHLVNKYGRCRFNCAFLDKYRFPENSQFMCELVYGEGYWGDLYKFLSHKDDDDALDIKIFDVLRLSGENMVKKSCFERIQALRHVNLTTSLNSLVFFPFNIPLATTAIIDASKIGTFFSEFVAAGYEGIVVKNINEQLSLPTTNWVKMKSHDQSDFKIVEIDSIKERITVGVEIFGNASAIWVGVKVMDKDKATLKVGDLVTIEHQGILPSGSLRHPVYLGKAVDSENK